MSLAHEVVPEKDEKDENKVVYRGPSPDEVTLVEFAEKLGFAFKSGDDRWINLEVQWGEVVAAPANEGIQMEFTDEGSVN